MSPRTAEATERANKRDEDIGSTSNKCRLTWREHREAYRLTKTR